MMARMTSLEFQQWMALEQIEPFGDRRLDLLCGLIGAILANIHRGPDDPPFSPEQFMPNFDRKEPEEQSAEAQMRILDSMLSNG